MNANFHRMCKNTRALKMIDKEDVQKVIKYLREYVNVLSIPCIISGSRFGCWHVTVALESSKDVLNLTIAAPTTDSGKFYFTDSKLAPHLCTASDDAVPVKIALPDPLMDCPHGWVIHKNGS